jgi:cytochrome P450
MTIGTFVRWGARHGLAGAVIRAGARKGEPHARLVGDPALQADPYPLYDEIRTRAAIVPGRLAMATARHDVITTILRDENFRVGFPVEKVPGAVGFLLRHTQDPAITGPLEPPSLLAVDAPDHTRYRRLVSRAFTPRAVERLHARIAEIAVDLLDALEREHGDAPSADLVATYASALPARVIADVLGVPSERHETFLRWGHAIAPSLDIGLGLRPYRRSEAALREMNAWLGGHFERLRRDPDEGILSGLVNLRADDGGPGLTEVELTSVAGLLLAAGFETTVNLLGNGVVTLLAHPDQLEGLRARPVGWRNAVEEILRFDSPVQNTGRHAALDAVVHGVPVARGRLVALLVGGANRDPAVFADPNRFDVLRANARDHLAFSGGVHFCLGAALARAEGEIGLRLLFERFPHLRAAGTPRRRPTRVLRGYDHVPVRLHSEVPAPR